MKKSRGSGHFIGLFLLAVVALAVFSVSVTLSLTFFQGITPPGKPWFPYFGLSLTEGGFLCWLGAFLWVRHHGFHTAVEFLMTVLSFLGIVATAGIELFSLMPGTTIDVHTALFANPVGILLVVVFLANILSVFIGAVVLYSESNPGWFRGGNGGNYIAQNHEQTGYHVEEQRGEPARPLASSRSDQPKEAPVNLENSAEIEPRQIEAPRQSPVKRPPPYQYQGESFPELLKEGLSSLLPHRRNHGEKQQ